LETERIHAQINSIQTRFVDLLHFMLWCNAKPESHPWLRDWLLQYF
jgi:hypothetical protein